MTETNPVKTDSVVKTPETPPAKKVEKKGDFLVSGTGVENYIVTVPMARKEVLVKGCCDESEAVRLVFETYRLSSSKCHRSVKKA